jgi:hypothetical protein
MPFALLDIAISLFNEGHPLKNLSVIKSPSQNPRETPLLSHLVLDYHITQFLEGDNRVSLRDDNTVRFFLGDVHGLDNTKTSLEIKFGPSAFLPIYMAKKDGYIISTSVIPDFPDAAPSGIILIPFERVRHILRREVVTDYVKQESYKILKEEILELQHYLNGEVFSLVFDEGTPDEIVEDMFYGANIDNNGMLSFIPDELVHATRLMMSAHLAKSKSKTTVNYPAQMHALWTGLATSP